MLHIRPRQAFCCCLSPLCQQPYLQPSATIWECVSPVACGNKVYVCTLLVWQTIMADADHKQHLVSFNTDTAQDMHNMTPHLALFMSTSTVHCIVGHMIKRTFMLPSMCVLRGNCCIPPQNDSGSLVQAKVIQWQTQKLSPAHILYRPQGVQAHQPTIMFCRG